MLICLFVEQFIFPFFFFQYQSFCCVSHSYTCTCWAAPQSCACSFLNVVFLMFSFYFYLFLTIVLSYRCMLAPSHPHLFPSHIWTILSTSTHCIRIDISFIFLSLCVSWMKLVFLYTVYFKMREINIFVFAFLQLHIDNI